MQISVKSIRPNPLNLLRRPFLNSNRKWPRYRKLVATWSTLLVTGFRNSGRSRPQHRKWRHYRKWIATWVKWIVTWSAKMLKLPTKKGPKNLTLKETAPSLVPNSSWDTSLVNGHLWIKMERNNFLLLLQNDPMSMERPQIPPKLKIIRDPRMGLNTNKIQPMVEKIVLTYVR